MPDPTFELLETEGSGAGSNDKDEAVTTNEKLVPKRLEDVKTYFETEFNARINGDIVLRSFTLKGGTPALVAFLNGMADGKAVNDFILRPLMGKRTSAGTRSGGAKIEAVLKSCLEMAEARQERDISRAADAVTDGMTALFIEGESSCIVLDTHGFEKRGIGQAENETVVLGPKESFTESLNTNITLIRRIIRSRDLIAETRPAGGMNNTRLALVYLSGTANPKLVAEIRKRLDNAKLRHIASSGTVDQLISDRRLLPVPQTLSTERPDRAAAHIMQGCVCLAAEGSPLVLIMPVTLFSLMNSPEDVYLMRPLGTLLRLIRYSGALISVMLPGYFLAMAMYHQGGLTAEVLSTVISSRKMVFEPIAIEMILLLLVFQLIREAGLRVPGIIGQAIGIIGGLIMGQAAVAANLASSVVLIIVALSGLGNFCIPDYSLQLSAAYFRMTVVLAAWIGGLLGIVAATMAVSALLVGQKSFGVPFLAPFTPKASSFRPAVIRGGLGALRADDCNNTTEEARS